MQPALAISLPHGLALGGVTTWALRLARALARRGRVAAIIAHDEPAGAATLRAPGVTIARVHGSLDDLQGRIDHIVDAYDLILGQLARRAAAPVVLSPNLLGDCYGVAAAITQRRDDVRVAAWAHSDNGYDARLVAHYQPAIARAVAVSAALHDRLTSAMPDRPAHVHLVPYGVEVPERHTPRTPGAARTRPLRLLYTGRFDHRQKRILALPHLSRALTDRGIDHALTLVGDGPAAADLHALINTLGVRRTVRMLPPASAGAIATRLRAADALVLASRFEGLSISMLEAMARGCVPIVTRVDSGAADAIEDGVTGLLADAAPADDDHRAAIALADAVERALALDLPSLSAAAWQHAHDRYRLDRHVDRVADLLDRAAADAPRAWPADRPCAFSAPGAAGAVPRDGAQRLASLLESLRDRAVAFHGVGQHTRALAHVIRAHAARLVAFTDDDPAHHGGSLLGTPIVPPRSLASLGVTDLIISTWLHEDAVWHARHVYERDGLRVHRIYADAA